MQLLYGNVFYLNDIDHKEGKYIWNHRIYSIVIYG